MAVVFSVEHMTCADCSERLEKLIKADESVVESTVLLIAAQARVRFAPSLSSEEVSLAHARLIGKAASLGFAMSLKVASGGSLRVDASDAASTVALAAAASAIGPSILSAKRGTCPQTAASLNVAYDPSAIGARHILGVLRRVGGTTSTTTVCHHDAATSDSARASVRFRLLFALALASAAIILTYIVPHTEEEGYDALLPPSLLLTPRIAVAWALATLAMMLYFRPLANAAWGAAVHSRAMTMDTLVCLSSGTAYVFATVLVLLAWARTGDVLSYGEPPFEATSVLLSLVMFARELEVGARGLTMAAMQSLLRLQQVNAVLDSPAPCSSGEGDAPKPCADCASGGSSSSSSSSIDAGAQTSEVRLNIIGGSSTVLLPSELIHVHDTLLVAPGSVIPADGNIVSGITAVDEALVTGESRPVPKVPGDAVLGGTVNGEGEVRVRVSAIPGTGAVSAIISLIEAAQASRPLVQSTANAIAGVFTPFVLVAACVTFAAWWSAAASGVVDTRGVAPAPFALTFALSLLVVSCPCAVALAVAPVMHAATIVAARVGLLVKGGLILEAAADVGCVVFDKTGTITSGACIVSRLLISSSSALVEAGVMLGFKTRARAVAASGALPALSATEAQLLAIAATICGSSPHPLAASIAATASARALPNIGGCCSAEERRVEAGRGILYRLNGDDSFCALGSAEWLERTLGVVGAIAAVAPLRAEGLSTVAIAVGDDLVGAIGLRDCPREGAAAALAALTSDGVEVWIASGDAQGAVTAIAHEVGVPLTRALGGLTPAEKVALVQRLQQRDSSKGGGRSTRVMMVGDGVNDAAALAAADVGVAMGAGASTTMECADVVIKENNLSTVRTLLRLARRARTHIQVNFAWAALYNLLAMPLAAGVLYPVSGVVVIPPGFSGLSELLSSVPVVIGALMMYRFER